MILNKELIEKKQLGETLNYVYPMSFDGEEKYGVIRIEGTSTDRTVQVYISNDKVGLEPSDEEVFQTNDIKKAWEKFEDLFNKSDEGKTQSGGEEPEVASLFLTFPLSGQSTLFLQNQKGQQKVLMEFEITDTDLILKQPRFYVLDYTDDENMPEMLRTKWAMANTNGDVKLDGTGEDYITYQVAILSVAPPDSHTPPQPPQPPSDEMEFYRYIRSIAGDLILNKFTYNKKTKTEVFIGQTTMTGQEKNGGFEVVVGGEQMMLKPYPTLDDANHKAYVLVSEGENENPSDELPFYRLVSFVGGILNLKLHTYNKKTKTEEFIQDTQFNGEDKDDFYEVNIDGQTMKLMPYPFLDKGAEKAYVMVIEGQDPPPPPPPIDNPPPPPPTPSDEMQFFRLISDLGETIVVSQNVFNKKTNEERMIRTLTYTATPKGKGYEIEIEGEKAKLSPYPKFDANGQQAYVLVMKGKGKEKEDDEEEDDEEEDENVMTFYRLIGYDGNVVSFNQYTLNKSDNTETFEGTVDFVAENKGTYFEAEIDGKTIRFGRFPQLDNNVAEAYVAVTKSNKVKSDDPDSDREVETREEEDDDQPTPDKEEDREGGESGRNETVSSSDIISAIAKEVDEDPNSIMGAFRSERFLESFLNDKNVNFSELGTKLNLPTNRADLVREIMKIVKQK